MRAAVGIDAGVGEAEAFDGAAVEEMLLDDLFGITGFGKTVPDGVGIDDEDGAVLALVEAARLVDADTVFQARGFDGIFESAAEFFPVSEGAAGAGGFVALVEADKEVMFEDWHKSVGCRGSMSRCGALPRRRQGMACENKGYGI